MPGRTPVEAIDAFLDPLREALACVARAKITLTPGARGSVGELHQWTLNEDDPVPIGGNNLLRASMHFELQDRGKSEGSRRFKVKTRGYMYTVLTSSRAEIIGFHWHPGGSSSWSDPHVHIGSAALSSRGVFPPRAHIPADRQSFEAMIRWLITELRVPPLREDWQGVLDRNESNFDKGKSW